MQNWDERYRNEGAIWSYQESLTAEIAARFFRENEKDNVFVIGIGYGRNVPSLRKQRLNIVGIDLAESACELGQRQFPFVHFLVGDYLLTQLEKQEAIYCFNVIHGVSEEEQIQFIEKIYDDLKNDGVAYITVLSDVLQLPQAEKKGRTLFTETSLKELIEHTPFEIESIVPRTDLFHYQSGLVKQYPLLCAKLQKNKKNTI